MRIEIKNFFLISIYLLTCSIYSQETQKSEVTAASSDTKLSLPVIGDVVLHQVGNAKVAELSAEIAIGPLILNQAQIKLDGDKLGITGQASLFGKAVRVGFKDLNFEQGENILVDIKGLGLNILQIKSIIVSKFTAVLDFVDKPTLEIIPDKRLTVDSAEITVDNKKPLQVRGTATILGLTVPIKFTVKPETLDITVEFKDFRLRNLFSVLEGTTLGNVGFSNVKAEIIDAFIIKGERKVASSVKITTSIKAQQTVDPFEKIPSLSRIIGFKNFDFIFVKDAKTYECRLKGEVELFSNQFNGTLRFIKTKEEKELVLLELQMPVEASFSDIIPAFKHSIFDEIELYHPKVLVAGSDFEEKVDDKTIKYKQGINFFADTRLKNALSPVAKITHTKEETPIVLSGMIAAPNPLNSVFKVQLPFMIPVWPNNELSIGKLTLEISGQPTPGIALLTTVRFKPTPRDQTLDFISRIQVSVNDALLAGTMLGTWNNPLGISGFKLADTALQIGMNYELLLAGIPIDKLGMAAKLGIGRRNVSFATNISLTHPDDFVFAGSLDRLDFKDLVDLISDAIHRQLDTSKIPEISIQNVSLYMVPKKTKIGELEFSQGFSGSATFIIEKFIASARFAYIDDDGISAEGWCTRFKVGPLLVSGTGPDKIYGTADDGPYLHLELTKSKQLFYLSAIVDLENVFRTNADVDLNKDQLSFDVTASVMHAFEATIHAKARINDPDVFLLLDFKADFYDYVQQEVDRELTAFQKKAEKEINEAQARVQQLNQQIVDFDRQIQERTQGIEKLKQIIEQKTRDAQQKIDEARKSVEQKRKELDNASANANRQIDDAKRKVDDARRDLDGVRQRANDLQQRWDRLPEIEKAVRWVDIGIPLGAAKAELGIKEGALNAATGFLDTVARGITNDVGIAAAKTALQVAEQTLDKVVKQVSFDPSSVKEASDITRLGIEIGGLQTAKAGAISAREVANGVLEAAKKTAYYAIGEGGKIIVKNLVGSIQIRHIRAEATGRDLIKGNMPKVTIETIIFGKKRDLKDLQFRFGNPLNPQEMPAAMAESAKSIADAIIKFLS